MVGKAEEEGWRFEASRTCPTCRGTGTRHGQEDPGHLRVDVNVCLTCQGKKRVSESLDVASLRALLASD